MTPYGYYPASYASPYNPYQQTMPQYQQTAQTQQSVGSGIPWVQGEAGAKAYSIGAGQSALLMDSECNTFYIKSTDGSGMPLPLRIFDYTERAAQNAPTTPQSTPIDTSLFVTHAELEERIAAILAAPAAKKTTVKKTESE